MTANVGSEEVPPCWQGGTGKRYCHGGGEGAVKRYHHDGKGRQ